MIYMFKQAGYHTGMKFYDDESLQDLIDNVWDNEFSHLLFKIDDTNGGTATSVNQPERLRLGFMKLQNDVYGGETPADYRKRKGL